MFTVDEGGLSGMRFVQMQKNICTTSSHQSKPRIKPSRAGREFSPQFFNSCDSRLISKNFDLVPSIKSIKYSNSSLGLRRAKRTHVAREYSFWNWHSLSMRQPRGYAPPTPARRQRRGRRGSSGTGSGGLWDGRLPRRRWRAG